MTRPLSDERIEQLLAAPFMHRGVLLELTPVRCALCSAPAVLVDSFFPFHRELNRCRRHARADERRARREREAHP